MESLLQNKMKTHLNISVRDIDLASQVSKWEWLDPLLRPTENGVEGEDWSGAMREILGKMMIREGNV